MERRSRKTVCKQHILPLYRSQLLLSHILRIKVYVVSNKISIIYFFNIILYPTISFCPFIPCPWFSMKVSLWNCQSHISHLYKLRIKGKYWKWVVIDLRKEIDKNSVTTKMKSILKGHNLNYIAQNLQGPYFYHILVLSFANKNGNFNPT